MTVRIVPMDGAGQAPVAVTMVSDQITLGAEVTAEAPAEEDTLSESEPPMARELTAASQAAFTDIQIPTWNLGERIPIAPQVWDADTPQVDVGTTKEDVDIVTIDPSEITPAEPKDVRKSPKEKRKRKRRRSAQQETDGQLVIRFKTTGSA
jgi:hypothetical protein